MRVIVCGGRDYDNWLNVNVTLSNLGEITHLAEGGAPGADYLSAQWCERHPDVLHYTFPADWERYGRGAGPRRNQAMLDEFHADVVVSFPGGRGTADMVARAVAAGVKVVTA